MADRQPLFPASAANAVLPHAPILWIGRLSAAQSSAHRFATDSITQLQLTHRAGNRAAGYGDVLVATCMPDRAHVIDLNVRFLLRRSHGIHIQRVGRIVEIF